MVNFRRSVLRNKRTSLQFPVQQLKCILRHPAPINATRVRGVGYCARRRVYG